jgi:hypothetical protein
MVRIVVSFSNIAYPLTGVNTLSASAATGSPTVAALPEVNPIRSKTK